MFGTNKLSLSCRIAVLIPCYNEAVTIAKVIHDFKAALPAADIFVFDNNSSDESVELAAKAGAFVRKVRYQGKGNVIRRMFADVDADVYVLVDGDDTYNAQQVPEFIDQMLAEGADMVVGVRKTAEQEAYRFGHQLGNSLLTKFAAFIFGNTFSDMLSGYRVFSRRYVKSFPAHAQGFETETELSIHALQLRMPVIEIESQYKARPDGSDSKLNTYSDGLRILFTILRLFRSEKPLVFFSLGFFACLFIAIFLAIPLLQTYLQTGLVPRFPTAILCAALTLFGLILLTCGLVLDTVTKGRIETKRNAYLAYPAPRCTGSKRDET
jgi:glycosyltransferase involved in cell wall biosynthesis